MNLNLNNIRRFNDENTIGNTKQKKFSYFPMSKILKKKSRRTVLGSIDANTSSKSTKKETVTTSNTHATYNGLYQQKTTEYSNMKANRQAPMNEPYVNGTGMTETEMMESDPTTPLITYKHMLRNKPSPKMDLVDQNDPQACTDYVKDIQAYLLESEKRFRVAPSYIENQREITSTMRKILVDWLIDVHYKFRMKSETLYLTIHIIDRYLEQRTIARHKLQLVGVVALLIAAKYEEIYPPRIRRLLSISADFYKRDELLSMERDVLNVLEFNITSVTTYQFLHRFAKAAKATDRIILLIFYFAELSQLDIQSLNYLPSQIAAACVYCACTLELRSWDNNLQYYTQYSEAELMPIAKFLLNLASKEQEQSKLNSIRKKWGRSSRHRISTFIPQDCEALLKRAPFAN